VILEEEKREREREREKDKKSNATTIITDLEKWQFRLVIENLNAHGKIIVFPKRTAKPTITPTEQLKLKEAQRQASSQYRPIS
jgi:hypothetical protein